MNSKKYTQKKKAVKKEKKGTLSFDYILHKDWILSAFFFAVVLLILFYQIIFFNNSFSTPDQVSASYTYYSLKKWFDNGIYPLWNPYIFSGMPAFSALSFNLFVYLPMLLYYPFTLIGIPGLIFTVFHYLIAGFGTFLLLRRWKLKPIPAFFGGLAYMIMPYLITMLVYGHGSQMMTAVYIPLVLWAVDRLLSKPNLFNVALVGLIMGIQLQRGHVQIAYYTWMLVGAYFIYFLILSLRKENLKEIFLKTTPYFIVALALAFCLSAVLYIPVHNYSKYSIRGGSGGGTGFDYATMWSFHPKEMMTFLNPSYYGFGGVTYWGKMPFTDYPNYMGILVLLLALLSVFIKKRKITIFFITVGALGLLVAFGKYFFLYKLFYKVLPYFNRFRVPAMILIVTQFCTAVLAGFGLNDLIEFMGNLDNSAKKKIKKIILVGLGVLVVFAVYLLLFKDSFKSIMFAKYPANPQWNLQQVRYINNLRFNMVYRDFWFMISFVSGSLILSYLLLLKRVSLKAFALFIVVISFFDLYNVDARIIKPRVSPKVNVKNLRDPACEFMASDSEVFRIFPVQNLFGDKHWGLFGLQSIGGYHPAKLKVYQDLIDNVGFKTMGILRMLNVKYLISPARFRDGNFEEVKISNTYLNGKMVPVGIYRLKNYLSRAFFVDSVRIIRDKKKIFSVLRNPDFDPREFAILEENPAQEVFKPDSTSVTVTKWGIHEMEFNVYTDKPSLLVISEIYYPNGWKAFIDGERTRIYKTNYVLRSVVVPSGKHTVRMVFKPRDIFWGLAISLISLAFIIVVMVVKRHEK